MPKKDFIIEHQTPFMRRPDYLINVLKGRFVYGPRRLALRFKGRLEADRMRFSHTDLKHGHTRVVPAEATP